MKSFNIVISSKKIVIFNFHDLRFSTKIIFFLIFKLKKKIRIN